MAKRKNEEESGSEQDIDDLPVFEKGSDVSVPFASTSKSQAYYNPYKAKPVELKKPRVNIDYEIKPSKGPIMNPERASMIGMIGEIQSPSRDHQHPHNVVSEEMRLKNRIQHEIESTSDSIIFNSIHDPKLFSIYLNHYGGTWPTLDAYNGRFQEKNGPPRMTPLEFFCDVGGSTWFRFYENQNVWIIDNKNVQYSDRNSNPNHCYNLYHPNESTSCFTGPLLTDLIFRLVGKSSVVSINELLWMIHTLYGTSAINLDTLKTELKHMRLITYKDLVVVDESASQTLLIDQLQNLFIDYAFIPLAMIPSFYNKVYRKALEWRHLSRDESSFESWFNPLTNASTKLLFLTKDFSFVYKDNRYFVSCPKMLASWMQKKYQNLPRSRSAISKITDQWSIKLFFDFLDHLLPPDVSLPYSCISELCKATYGYEPLQGSKKSMVDQIIEKSGQSWANLKNRSKCFIECIKNETLMKNEKQYIIKYLKDHVGSFPLNPKELHSHIADVESVTRDIFGPTSPLALESRISDPESIDLDGFQQEVEENFSLNPEPVDKTIIDLGRLSLLCQIQMIQATAFASRNNYSRGTQFDLTKYAPLQSCGRV